MTVTLSSGACRATASAARRPGVDPPTTATSVVDAVTVSALREGAHGGDGSVGVACLGSALQPVRAGDYRDGLRLGQWGDEAVAEGPAQQIDALAAEMLAHHERQQGPVDDETVVSLPPAPVQVVVDAVRVVGQRREPEQQPLV